MNLKSNLQPLLLMIFATDTTLLTCVSYLALKDQNGLYFVPYLPYTILQLSYIVYTLEDCHDQLKSSVDKLRLNI